MDKEEELRTKLEKMLSVIKDRPSTIAKKAGINQSNLSAAMNGRRVPTYELIVKIARAYEEINPLFVLYESTRPVLRVDEDFIPYMCKDTEAVIRELHGCMGGDSFMDFFLRFELEEFEGYVVPEGDYDVYDCGEEGYEDELAIIDRGFTLENLKSLHENFPDYSIFWMMGREKKKFDKPYAELDRESFQRKRELEKQKLLVSRLKKELEGVRALVTDKEALASYDESREKLEADERGLSSKIAELRKRIPQLDRLEGDHKKEVSELNNQIQQAKADLAKIRAELYSQDA